MLNPSTADDKEDDNTIIRCINFANDWGYGGLMVGNLFTYRTTYPKELFKTKEPEGKENLKYIKQMIKDADLVICVGEIIKVHLQNTYEKSQIYII